MTRVFFRLFFKGIFDLRLNPWAQIGALAGVTLVAFLSGLFLMAMSTLNHQLGMVSGETAFQVYWHTGTDESEIRAQWQDYANLPGFRSLRAYTPDDALRELGARLGRSSGSLGQDFPFLAGKSPLPATALLSFAPEAVDIDRWTAETVTYLKNRPGVSRVVTTPLRDELGRAWRKVSRYVMWPSVGLLTLVLGLVVANTVRLSLIARAHEIEILQLAGAYAWYIRLPLVTGGAVVGFGGGFIAFALLKLVHLQIRDVLNFPPLLMEIQFPSGVMALALLLAPMLTAAASGWLAVRGEERH